MKRDVLTQLILAVIIIFLTIVVNAKVKTPISFIDSKILRRLDNGKMQVFDGNKYKIVHRRKYENNEVSKTITKTITKKIYIRKPERKNTFMVHSGYAPVGLNREIVIGLSYQHSFNNGVRFQILGLSNKSIINGIGVDF